MNGIYKVNEIFHSLQGEGYHAGTPAVFLRFSGCNRKCGFCDTDHHDGKEMTLSGIRDAVIGYPSRHIVITGGEPALQIDRDLLGMLKKLGFFIQIETNGSLPVPDGVDWVTCSPKEGPWAIGRIDELKVVYQGQDVEAIAVRFPSMHRFLQPCSGKNIRQTIDYILTHPHWRLSLQIHKLVDIH